MNRSRIGHVLKSPWFWVIAAGYTLRIAVMPITGQHDVMFMPWMTHYINQGNLNLYAFLYEKFGDIVMQRPAVWAPYPYVHYLFTAGWLEVLEGIGLLDLADWESVWQVSQPARWVFLFKAAYLPFDLGIGYLLYRTSGRIGWALWAWSPLAIYTPFMMGQNDIYATAFAVAGAYAASKAIETRSENQHSSSWLPGRWAVLTSVLLGTGSTFKLYPLLLLPPLVLTMEQGWRRRFILLCIGCSLLVTVSLPFLTTPTYVNGVLLNPEGAEIFREIQTFGRSVSPFLLGYLVLLGFLSSARRPSGTLPQTAWFVCLAVLALLFLWVPTPLYWLIWITPFLIGVMGRIPKAPLAWATLQFSFAILLSTEHPELGVALPVHLAANFTVPNLPTALAVTHPTLYRIFIALLPIASSLLVASLLATAWCSIKALAQQPEPTKHDVKPHWSMGLPMAALLLILVVNLFFARNLASRTNWHEWESQALAHGETILQELSLERQEITGVRLRVGEPVSPATLKVCLYRDLETDQEPVTCASRNTTQQVENRTLYFVFDERVSLQADTAPTLRIQVEDTGATVVLPYTTEADEMLQFNGTTLNGSLDVSPLWTFSAAQAFDGLVVENILKDTWLLVTILIATVLVTGSLGLMLTTPQASVGRQDCGQD
jgi:hypothetical protein